MKVKQEYLKGKSVFIVSLLVISITILTVYLTGTNYNRSITSNFYISLSIIGAVLFIFMTYGLYTGSKLKDNFPKFKSFKPGEFIGNSTPSFDMPTMDGVDSIGGIILAILLWIIMTLLIIILLIVFEAIFWFSIFIILTTLYWVFFRALKLVFSKSKDTRGSFKNSIMYALNYTTLYLGWIFGIVYITEILQ